MNRNIGTTHVAMALSNYLCNKRLSSTAYVEVNGTNEISCLRKKPTDEMFRHMNIAFYPNSTFSMFNEIRKKEYKYIILDFGVLNTYSAKEFMRCDKRYILCSCSPWKEGQFSNYLGFLEENNINVNTDITLLGNLVEKNSYPDNFKFMNHKFDSIPYIANPFLITSQYFKLFENILERN